MFVDLDKELRQFISNSLNNIQQEIKHIRQKELIRFKRVARATSNGTLPFLEDLVEETE